MLTSVLMGKITPYLQVTSQSCLASCLLMLNKYYFKRDFCQFEDQLLTFEGLKRQRNYFLLGVLEVYSQAYQHKVTIYADNNYFSKVLNNGTSSNLIITKKKPIRLLVEERIVYSKNPFILFIDLFYLKKGVHSPHYVIVEKYHKGRLVLVDPWFGRRFYWTKEKCIESIKSLKTHLGFCPVVIELNI